MYVLRREYVYQGVHVAAQLSFSLYTHVLVLGVSYSCKLVAAAHGNGLRKLHRRARGGGIGG